MFESESRPSPETKRFERETTGMSLYDSLAELSFSLEAYDLRRRERETSSGFTRVSTVVALSGAGEPGFGEDVTYDADEHDALLGEIGTDAFPPAGEYTVDSFSAALDDRDLFAGRDPAQAAFRNYRRWALESAALDLALKQADSTLASALDREYEPVRFAMSTRLGEPPTFEPIERWLETNPSLEFKLDPTSAWTPELIDRLAATGAVRVVDLKGQYHGTSVDQPADPELYRRVVEGLPEALIEDPELTAETRAILDGETERVTWDYPITGVESIEALEWSPEWLNLKPSRFGSLRSVFETIEYCRERGIRLYGGGQFELDVGREHIHALASLFYPDAPNDVAPIGYNDPEPSAGLAESPLVPRADQRGLGWQFADE